MTGRIQTLRSTEQKQRGGLPKKKRICVHWGGKISPPVRGDKTCTPTWLAGVLPTRVDQVRRGGRYFRGKRRRPSGVTKKQTAVCPQQFVYTPVNGTHGAGAEGTFTIKMWAKSNGAVWSTQPDLKSHSVERRRRTTLSLGKEGENPEPPLIGGRGSLKTVRTRTPMKGEGKICWERKRRESFAAVQKDSGCIGSINVKGPAPDTNRKK